MNKILFSAFILFITIFSASAQSYELSSAMDFYRANKMTSANFGNTLSEENIEGSPYLNDEFADGTIYTTSKLQFVDVPLRYNIYTENLEYKNNEDQVLAMANPETIERAKFGETEMVYIPYTNAKKIRRSFFKIVAEGKISLYARPQIIYKEAEEPKAYAEAAPARFIKKADMYYLRNGKNEAIKVDKKKELIEFFPAHNDEVATFIKKNKIKANKQEDLKELVEYYNSNF